MLLRSVYIRTDLIHHYKGRRQCGEEAMWRGGNVERRQCGEYHFIHRYKGRRQCGEDLFIYKEGCT